MYHRRKRSVSKQSLSFVRRQRRQTVFRIILAVILIPVFFWGISHLTSLESLTIYSVEVYGVTAEDAGSIRQKINETIEGKYFWLFSRSNALLYPRDGVAQAVQSLFPQIEQVNVKLKNRHVLVVTITEKNAAAVVCTHLPDFDENRLILEDADGCYFTDNTGILFSEAPVFSGPTYKRYYAPDSGNASSTNGVVDRILDTETFEDLQQFYQAVQDAKITAEAILIKPDGEYELYVSNPTYETENEKETSTAIVYFNSESTFSGQLDNLIPFWNNQISEGRISGKMPVFDSIDIRYGSNVFYRLTTK